VSFAVLIVDDDFRVARLHARLVEDVPDFRVVGVAHTAEQARQLVAEHSPDLVLLDNYLPDQQGVELAAHLGCDVLMVTADSSAALVRAAVAAGAVNVLVKPFTPERLAGQLSAYARYRGLLAFADDLGQQGVDRALAALRQASRASPPKGQSSVTARLVAERLRTSDAALTAADVADALGISRATAQRYLAALTEIHQASVSLRYGSTGRPEHLYRWGADVARAE
jgi:two-component system CitB family response regulator